MVTYATTNNGVQAVAVDAIPTNPTFRTMEQNKTLQKANERVSTIYERPHKTSYPMVKKSLKVLL